MEKWMIVYMIDYERLSKKDVILNFALGIPMGISESPFVIQA